MAAIPFVFCAVLSLILLQANAQKNISCSTSVTSTCASCKNQTICPSQTSGTNTSSSCISGQVCKYDSGLATCTDPATVPGCKCNSSGSTITYQCDFYNSQVSIACFKGAIQSSSVCKPEEVCNKATGKCIKPPPTTTTVSPPTTSSTTTSAPVTCGPESGLVNKNNCTSIAFCSEGVLNANIQTCDPGQIFSIRVSSCVNYASSFSCPEPVGVFPDPFNCSLVHTCKNNMDSISLCPDGQNFDPDLRQCAAGSTCAPELCTPCTSTADIFPVNETTCVPKYNQCRNVSNPDSDNFKLEEKTCPGLYVFDPKKKACFPKCSFFRNDWNLFG